jgi:hypothetical protein
LAETQLQAVGGGSILVDRVPCALGATLPLRPFHLVETVLEADVALGAIRASGQGYGVNDTSTRMEVGARFAVDFVFDLGSGLSHVAAVVGLEATDYPVTYDLEVTRSGVVAQTPALWLGASVGLSWPRQ